MAAELAVRDILTTDYIGVSESDTVQGAVSLMRDERASCVLILRGSEPQGIMTEWDVLGLVADGDDPADLTVRDVMTAPVLTIDVDQPVRDAAATMATKNIRTLVVTDAGEVAGVLTERDVIAAAGSFTGTLPEMDSTEPNQLSEFQQPGSSEIAPNGGDEYSSQGVCETCGSLTDTLYDANGQLVCADCRSV